MTAPRFAAIDVLKTAGIAAVVLIHTMRPPWDPAISGLETWIGHATRFGVPAFLFASGFLYATRRPVGAGTTARRLRRVLGPYLVASAAAQVWRAWRDAPYETGSLASDLLLGASFGPYYYVFVIVFLVLATPAFARLSGPAVLALTAAFVIAQWCVDAASLALLPLTWHIRNPLLWWAFFLLGWAVRLHLPQLTGWLAAHRRGAIAALASAAVVLTAASALEQTLPRLWLRTAAWLDVYVILALGFALGHGARSPAALRFTSDATYAIYLFHLFFVLPVRDALPPPPGAVSWSALLLPWAAGLGGPMLLVAAGRALLGERSRAVLGA